MNQATKPLFVGIAGGSGSGKTYLAREICSRFARFGAGILDYDSYYLDQSHLDFPARARLNFDHPAALDHGLLFDHLRSLAAMQPVTKPRYDFTTHLRLPEGAVFEPAPVIVVEGLFALWSAEVRSVMDLRIFVDADPDIRFIRRLRRDVVERGRTLESVVSQYMNCVRPMYGAHIEPTKAYANLVLDNTENVDLERAFGAVEQRMHAFAATVRS